MAISRERIKKTRKSRFVNDASFHAFTQPTMIRQAQDLLTREDQTEEGFLGAQAILLINGLL